MSATIHELRPRKVRGQSRRRPVTDGEAAQVAWSHVLNGFEQGIASLPPGHSEHEELERLMRLAKRVVLTCHHGLKGGA